MVNILNLVRLKVNNVSFKGRLSFVVKAQKSIVSAAFLLGISSAATAFLGIFKGRLLATYFGVTNELGIFYVADKVPSLLSTVVIVGALSTVFIPVFTDLKANSEKKAWEVASAIINISVLFFILISILVIIFSKDVIRILSVDKFSSAEIALGANLMSIMMAAQILLVISSFFTSILQSFKYFLIPSLAPVLYNAGLIAGIIFFEKKMGIYAPAIGVVIGAVLHLAIQIPNLTRANFSYKFVFNSKAKEIKELLFLIPPRILNVILGQLIATINNSLAILISTASVVTLKFASQLQFFPVQLFGASMATAALPILSGYSNEEKELAHFKKIFVNTLHQVLFFVMPASAILLILRIPVVRLVYGVDNFPWQATIETSYALAFFSLSIFAQSSYYLFTRAFYALKDSKTPVKVSLITIVINICLSLFFVKKLQLGVWSIAFSYSITSILDTIALWILLSKKLGGFEKVNVFVPFIKICYATILMCICLYTPLKLLDIFVLDTTKTLNLLILTIIATTIGGVSYLFFTWVFKVEEIQLLYKLLNKLKLKEAKHIATLEISENSTNI